MQRSRCLRDCAFRRASTHSKGLRRVDGRFSYPKVAGTNPSVWLHLPWPTISHHIDQVGGSIPSSQRPVKSRFQPTASWIRTGRFNRESYFLAFNLCFFRTSLSAGANARAPSGCSFCSSPRSMAVVSIVGCWRRALLRRLDVVPQRACPSTHACSHSNSHTPSRAPTRLPRTSLLDRANHLTLGSETIAFETRWVIWWLVVRLVRPHSVLEVDPPDSRPGWKAFGTVKL